MSDGVALGLKLERLGPAQALLQSAQRWTQRARRILEAAADAAQSSADEVMLNGNQRLQRLHARHNQPF